jgi:2-hydroxychromene-2-carboxylate isomerase
MKSIRYYIVPQSPWTYLGHERLVQITARHGASIDVRPIDLGRIFPISGGLPLAQRASQRQAYRLVELKRWSAWAGLPLTLHPKHFPVPGNDASLVILSAGRLHGSEAALRLTGALLRAVWAQERNIADLDTLARIGTECGVDGQRLVDERENDRPTFDRHTEEAIEDGVFGVPWYAYNGEPFWGQDRLDMLDRALAR